MENSLVDEALDECSQLRIILVGSAKGKAQLVREVFGVNRITKYPADFSRDDEVYSKENEYFIAHILESWDGVANIIRRRQGEPDERIHCIWHYVDAQEADDLVYNDDTSQRCPNAVRRSGVPIITVFGRFDNIINRSAEIGRKRRFGEALDENDMNDGKQIQLLSHAISLYSMQFPSVITSKSPSSKLVLLEALYGVLKDEIQMLLVVAQRLNPTWKFETSLQLAMKQFLIGTISTASPLPIPFAGLIGSSAASYMIKQDIIKVWNIYDPDYLCAGAQGQASVMDTLMGLPQLGAKRLIYMIPVIAQINGIWETPRMAKALGGLMIDLTLLMERAFLATMNPGPELIRPASLPLTQKMLERIITDYKPIQEAVREELDDFFDLEHSGLQRSFQKDTVRRKLDEIVHKWRKTL